MAFHDILAVLVVVFLWGFNVVAIKTGVGEFPPMFMTGLRFTVVALLVTPFTVFPRHEIKKIILLSITMGICHFGFLFIGLSGMEGSTSSIIIQLGTPFSIILAIIFFKEKVQWPTILGLVFAFVGVVVLAGEPRITAITPPLFILGAALGWAVSNLIIKRISNVNAITINGWMCFFASMQLIALSFIFEENQIQAITSSTWKGWVSVLYTAVAASITAHSLWYHLLSKHSVNQITPFALLGPVISVFASIMFLGEELTFHKALGGMITISGVAVIELYRLRRFTKDAEKS